MTSAGKTPSKGAVRAAMVLSTWKRNMVGEFNQSIAEIAEVIEQSTHAGEMVELLRERHGYGHFPQCHREFGCTCDFEKVERLLAEMEREA